jgi:hypothetical protein
MQKVLNVFFHGATLRDGGELCQAAGPAAASVIRVT